MAHILLYVVLLSRNKREIGVDSNQSLWLWKSGCTETPMVAYSQWQLFCSNRLDRDVPPSEGHELNASMEDGTDTWKTTPTQRDTYQCDGHLRAIENWGKLNSVIFIENVVLLSSFLGPESFILFTAPRYLSFREVDRSLLGIKLMPSNNIAPYNNKCYITHWQWEHQRHFSGLFFF